MFDFNQSSTACLYSIFPQTPFPVEVSIYGGCSMSCVYCFANLNRKAADRDPAKHAKNSTEATLRTLDRAMADEFDPIGYFLRERFPVCFSNRTDPFQQPEAKHRATEVFLKWAAVHRVPLFIQSRGSVLLKEWERYADLLEPGRVVWYMTLETLDDATGKAIAPGAPLVSDRLRLMRWLTDHGIPVVAACNPYLRDWCPDPAAYCRVVADAGGRGVWLEALHFTAGQADAIGPKHAGLIPKSNLAPMYLIGQLKQFYEATAAAGLDFYPTPRWDAYFGHKAKHPECVDPAWVGGRTFHWMFTLLREISDLHFANGRQKMLIYWPWVERWLTANGMPNPVLSTSQFWLPFNNKVNGDHREFVATLGKQATLLEILRYFWNHPWTCANFVWYHPFMRLLCFSPADDVYVGDEDSNLISCFDSSIKHHGSTYVYESELSSAGHFVWQVQNEERRATCLPAEVAEALPQKPFDRLDAPAFAEGNSP